MAESFVWLVAILSLYAAYCVYWGVACARNARGARSFFLADRDLPAWVFVLTGTGASFSGWIALGHPDITVRDGFPFAGTALGSITIALAGVLFLKRQWMLGKRYGYVTPAEMFGDYFGGEGIRLYVLLIALVFAVPFAGLQIGAAGALVAALSGGAIDPVAAMWGLTGIVFAYVCIGGLRATAFVGTLQALLLGAGIVALGVFAIGQAGGFGAFTQSLFDIGRDLTRAAGPAAPEAHALFQVPGVMQFNAGLGVEAPAGGLWTASMIFSYCVALASLPMAPAFTMLAFAARSPKGFAAQQIWATAGIMGAILVIFGAAVGFALRVLPGIDQAALARPEGYGGVVGLLIVQLAPAAPWFVGILAVCGLAAVQIFVGLHVATTSTMLVRDLYRRYVDPRLDLMGQRRGGRIAGGLLLLSALLLATFAPQAEALLGALALGFGVQLLPALAGLCWLPWITRPGVGVGLGAGLVAVIFTEALGPILAGDFGLHLPWGRWPWTLHSAAWGLACNLVACLVVSAISQQRADTARRQRFHDFLATHSGTGRLHHGLRPLAWAATLIWLFFAIGPGVVYANWMAGGLEGGRGAGLMGMPPIWAWQIGWWVIGVLLVWFLADRMKLSGRPGRTIEALPRSQRPPSDAAVLSPGRLRDWIGYLALGACLVVLVNWMFG